MQNSTKQLTKARQADRNQEISQEASRIGTGIIFILSVLIGIWGLACLLSGITQHGALEVIKSWIGAVMGG